MYTVLRRWSHVGRRLVSVDSRVTVDFMPAPPRGQVPFGQTAAVQVVRVSGPLGSLDFPIVRGLTVSLEQGAVPGEKVLKVDADSGELERMSKYCRKFVKSMWGTTNSILRQNVEGVFEVPLRLVGVGYKACIEGNRINLKVGYSHDILLQIPEGVKASTPIPTKIVLTGSHYQSVTQFAAKIRSYRKPEPYNGKGIFVGNETIALKEGKKK